MPLFAKNSPHSDFSFRSLPVVPTLSLTIYRKDDINIVDLSESGTLIPRCEVQVETGFINELVLEINRSLGEIQQSLGQTIKNASEEAVIQLKRLGAILFQQAIPQRARDFLIRSEGGNLYLRLDDKLIHVPWELCFDGENFIGLKFCVGKQVITEYRNEVTVNQAGIPGKEIKVLLVADPTETLKAASREVERLAGFLDDCKGFKVSILGGRQVTKTALLKAFAEYDALHFAGHADFIPGSPGKSGWILHDSKLTSSEIGNLPKVPQLIFSNSCQGTGTSSWDNPVCLDNPAFGIGSSFLIAGVKNFIGSPWRLQDQGSAEFATDFYKFLVKDNSLGEALLKSKWESIKKRGWRNPLWASYSLFGDPGYRFPLETQHKPKIKGGRREKGHRSWQIAGLSIVFILAVASFGYWVSKQTVFQNHLKAELNKNETGIHAPSPKKEFLKPYELTFLQGFEHFKKAKVASALKYFKELSLDKLEMAKAYGKAGQAIILFESGDIIQAKNLLKKSLLEEPDNSFAHLVQGDIWFSEGDEQKALRSYRKASTSGPAIIRTEALNGEGFLSRRLGNANGALEAFQKCLAIRSDNRDCLLNLGYYHLEKNENRKAKESFDRVLRVYHEDEIASYFLKEIQGNLPQSSKVLKKDTIAVVPFLIVGGNPRVLGVGEAFSGKLSESLLQNKINALRQDEIKSVLPEGPIKKVLSLDEAIQMGKSLPAQFVIYGKLKTHFNLIGLDLNLVRVSDGTVFLSKSLRVEKKPLLANLVLKSGNLISSTLSRPVVE
ncbi:hypothetical protein UZ36_07260 [Candidatus Nitromaritima sp. SCGC AAA799-C22]|nr:hypothetical protein UZ36_07260 [Candidatus Nitromaritima sp. SCGC AAA799-C22]